MSAFVTTPSGIAIPSVEQPPPAPFQPNRAQRRALLKGIKSQLRREKRKGDNIMDRALAAGMKLEQVRLLVKDQSPASMIRPLPGSFA